MFQQHRPRLFGLACRMLGTPPMRHFTALQPLFALSRQRHEGSLEPALCNLALMRASQSNGCAYCLALRALARTWL